ncbi:MAG: metal-sensing transcriptional repressor [candidate division Zixibacteria bacterium]|nr:metal-sensing transcriptional repressor [candidate division Zixibacteria bacterium]
MNEKVANTGITNERLKARLARVEGQVRGVSRMLDERKYCIDVVDQITAARRALEKVALLVMQRHMNSCVKDAMAKGRGEELTKELLASLDKFLR